MAVLRRKGDGVKWLGRMSLLLSSLFINTYQSLSIRIIKIIYEAIDSTIPFDQAIRSKLSLGSVGPDPVGTGSNMLRPSQKPMSPGDKTMESPGVP